MAPAEREAFRKRSEEIGARLREVKGTQTERHGRHADGSGQGMAYGLRMASELVAAVLVGGLVGYGLDHWLGTRPWLFLVMFTIGFAAGVTNVLRAYNRLQEKMKAKTGGDVGRAVKDDDD
jgi:ATP synthase protein I